MGDFDASHQTASQRRPHTSSLTLIIALLVVVIVAAYWFATQGPGQRVLSPANSDIAQFSGDDNEVTTSFVVRGQWQVHWENQGPKFAFAIDGDDDLGTIVDQREPGSGVTNVVPAGTFHLEITAKGPWNVRITQGE